MHDFKSSHPNVLYIGNVGFVEACSKVRVLHLLCRILVSFDFRALFRGPIMERRGIALGVYSGTAPASKRGSEKLHDGFLDFILRVG